MGKKNKRKRGDAPTPVADNPGTVSTASGAQQQSMEEWIAQLAKKEAAAASSGGGAAAAAAGATTSSKEERIAKRAAKKRKREEQKLVRRARQEQQRALPTAAKRQRKRMCRGDDEGEDLIEDVKREAEQHNHQRLSSNESRQRTQALASTIEATVQTLIAQQQREREESGGKGEWKKKRKSAMSTSAAAQMKRPKWDANTVQPRRRDYAGIGLARPSLFLPLDDPSFVPRLEEEFREHVPGFFGKQKTKAMKKQLNKNMLWRRMLDSKHKGNNGKGLDADGKKISNMTPDERVEAMIKAGII